NGNDCLAGTVGVDANLTACIQKTLDKVTPGLPGALAGLPAALDVVINDATKGLFDRFDPSTVDPAATPCGNCGNAIREGAEECDGASDAACPGSCTTACACP